MAKELSICNPIEVNYRVCETLWGTDEFEQAQENGGIFSTLEFKTKEVEVLRESALSGVEVRDTEDWLAEATTLFPEDSDSLGTRYDCIAQHYKNIPIKPGESMCIVVATHAAIVMNLPPQFNSKTEPMRCGYCSSWQAMIKVHPDGSREEPVIICELHDSYITTK